MENWLPVKLLEEENALQWMRFDELAFTEPFFDETIMRIRAKFPENRSKTHSVTTTTFLRSNVNQPLPPNLLVHHVSRCGSTLLAQLLGLDPETTVLSEVPLLDQLLVACTQSGTPEADDTFRAAVHLLRRNHPRLVIKADSWHLLHHATLRRIWPDVPVLVLYRHPAEVLRSHRKRSGMHAVPGLLSEAQLPGVNGQQHPDPYFGELMTLYFRQLQHIRKTDARAVLMNYAQGPETLVETAAQLAGFTFSAAQQKAIAERARFNAKAPDEVFAEHREPVPVPEWLKEAVALYADCIEERDPAG